MVVISIPLLAISIPISMLSWLTGWLKYIKFYLKRLFILVISIPVLVIAIPLLKYLVEQFREKEKLRKICIEQERVRKQNQEYYQQAEKIIIQITTERLYVYHIFFYK